MSRTIVVAVLGASACSGETAFDTESGGGSTTAVGLTSGGDQATTTGAGVPTTGVVPPGSEATDAGETTASVTLSGAATGETTAGETTAGATTAGATTAGETTEGESTEGESTVGESTVGESTVGESTVGESTGGETTGEPFDPLLCGNGVLDPGETCDDGGVDPADDCSATCSEQKVVSVVAGQAHTCALLSAGKVKCWGPGAYGQLGLGSKTAHGFMPGDMGDKLPYVDLGGPAVALAAGDFFTCAARGQPGQVLGSGQARSARPR